MKKLFTLLMAATLSLGSYAKDYTDMLVVNVNGTSTRQTATISVDKNADGTYNFNLKNFMLKIGDQSMGIGNITLNNLEAATSSKGDVVSTHRDITITKGDDPNVDTWMGPMLGTIPLDLKLLVNNEKLYTLIDIDMQQTLKQTIHVTFGDNYQLPNSGFEDYRTEQITKLDDSYKQITVNVEEPLNWHSFASATGDFVQAANAFSDPHTYSSDVVRSGATGKKSLLLTSASVFGIVANGTITTGRMQAGAMTAADTKNCAFLSTDNTSTDSHGDPFYALMDGTPDAIAVWVKFKQGTPNAEHPYATISAAITDGTYYQDPQDKVYTNVVATAKNAQIASNNFEWQRIVVPFKYDDNDVKAKAMLVTISTNADPGQGSDNDNLYVDDISLVYNVEQPALSVDGKNVELSSSELTAKTADIANAVITPTTSNHGSFTAMNTISSDDTQKTVRILYCANDLSTIKEYTLTLVKDGTSGINSIADKKDGSAELYNLAGQRINNAQPGQVVIVKKGGKAVKVLK